jgi:hypothetical protein
MKIVGHQLEGVHGGYGNPWVLPDESILIDSVQFDGIDFANYPVQQISKQGTIHLERPLQQDPGTDAF